MSRSRKAGQTLVVLLILGAASATSTSANSQTVYGALAEHPASIMATDRTRVLNDAKAIQCRAERFVRRVRAPRPTECSVSS